MIKRHFRQAVITAPVPGPALFLLLALALFALPDRTAEAAGPCQVVLTDQQQISLGLDWKFARGSIPQAKDLEFDDSAWPAASPPFRWASLAGSYGSEIWMRCRIVLAGPRPDPIYLQLDQPADAFEVYFNGSLIGREGSITPFSPAPGDSAVVPIPGGVWKEQNVLALRLLAATPLSTFRSAPVLSRRDTILGTRVRLDALALPFCILLTLAALALATRAAVTLHIRSNGVLSALCLLVAAHQSIQHGMRSEWFDSYPGSFVTQMILAIPLPALLLEYMLTITRSSRGRPIRNVYLATATLLVPATAVTFLPAHLQALSFQVSAYVYLMLLISVIATGIYVLRSQVHLLQEKARIILPALLLLFAAAVHDILGATGLLQTHGIFVFAFALFLTAVLLQHKASTPGAPHVHESPSGQSREPQVSDIIHNVQTEFKAHAEAFRRSLKQGRAKNAQSNGQKNGPRNGQPATALERWISDARILSQIQDGTLEARQARFSIREQVESAAKEATEATGERPNRLMLHLPPASERFWADVSLVHACIFHLIENALLYSNGRIEVRAERSGSTLHLRVRDEGPGMPRDLQERAFAPFVRGPGRTTPGSGLGLTLVDRAVAVLRGRLHLESGQGFFTLVEIDLPEMQEAER